MGNGGGATGGRCGGSPDGESGGTTAVAVAECAAPPRATFVLGVAACAQHAHPPLARPYALRAGHAPPAAVGARRIYESSVQGAILRARALVHTHARART